LFVGAQGSMEHTVDTTCHGAERRESRTAANISLSIKDRLNQLNAKRVRVSVDSKNLLTKEATQTHKNTQQAANKLHNPRLAKLAYIFTGRHIARLTARETERMIEPLEMYAHVPGLLRGYARLEQATARLHRFDERLKNLAELRAASLTKCEYCIDFGSQVARRSGLSDEQLLALPSYRTSALFT